MKDFISLFLICFVLSFIILIFFAELIFNSIWAILVIISFLLAVFIKIFMYLETRIEELENKIEHLLNDK